MVIVYLCPGDACKIQSFQILPTVTEEANTINNISRNVWGMRKEVSK